MSNVRFMTENGEVTTDTDPKRAIWYGFCGYWTDDWTTLRTAGVPGCPTCGAPGCQIDAEKWFDGARKFQDGNPMYLRFLVISKGHCFKGVGFLKSYQAWYRLEKLKADNN